jgi:Outer membrane protein beta-barrel domain
MYVLTRILIFIALVSGTSMLHAQASPTATRLGDLKIGGGYSNANTDYVPERVSGGTAYVDFDFRPHIGIEGEFHYVKHNPSNIYEKSYQVGGRYFRTYHKFVPYGKLMYGRGVFNFADFGVTTANLAYNMLVGGVGVDYKALPWLYVRGDFEYQRWFGFPPNGLTPTIVTIGAAYHFR